MKNLTPLLLIITCLISCTQQAEIDNAQITKEVSNMFETYTNHVNTEGLQGVESFFSSDKRFYWVEDGITQYSSHKALKSGIEEFAPSVKSVNLKVGKLAVTPINGKMASLYVEYKEDLELNSGYAFTLDGAMTILLMKERGSWKFFQGHSSIKKPRGN